MSREAIMKQSVRTQEFKNSGYMEFSGKWNLITSGITR